MIRSLIKHTLSWSSYCISQDISWKPASRWRFKVHYHLRPPPRGYLRGSKATQSSMIPSHMFTEHQRSETRARRICRWRRGPPRRICKLLESRKHESAKGTPSAPAVPKMGRAYANRAWILGIWRRTTLRLILSPFEIIAHHNFQAIIYCNKTLGRYSLKKKILFISYNYIIAYLLIFLSFFTDLTQPKKN